MNSIKINVKVNLSVEILDNDSLVKSIMELFERKQGFSFQELGDLIKDDSVHYMRKMDYNSNFNSTGRGGIEIDVVCVKKPKFLKG